MGNRWQFLATASPQFSSNIQLYGQELLALTTTLQKWRRAFLPADIEAYTDYRLLQYLLALINRYALKKRAGGIFSRHWKQSIDRELMSLWRMHFQVVFIMKKSGKVRQGHRT